VSEEVLEQGRMAVKNPPKGNISSIFELFHEESAILAVLHLTLVALVSSMPNLSNSTLALEIMPDLRKICKSGIALQKLVKAEDIENWMFLVHINALSSTFLSMLLNSLINETDQDSGKFQLMHPSLRPFR
jgi:hypothetical protein